MTFILPPFAMTASLVEVVVLLVVRLSTEIVGTLDVELEESAAAEVVTVVAVVAAVAVAVVVEVTVAVAVAELFVAVVDKTKGQAVTVGTTA